MRILLSAFAYAPNIGSEAGVGWRWAFELGKHHDVTVVTDVTRKPLVEAEGVALPPNVQVTYFRPRWLCAMPLNSATAPLLYTLWQFGLLGFARKLQRERAFDLAIHCTYGVFRHPSFLGYLGIPFVFGPVGGGEDAPALLKRSIRGREKLKEYLRGLLNKLALFDPFLWAAYGRATLILTKTDDTRRALPWPFRRLATVYPEIGIDVPTGVEPPRRQPGEPLRVLFAGRLLGWKGAHLAIRAVAQALAQDVLLEFTLLGRGPLEPTLRRLAADLGVEQRISWVSQMPQQELLALYRTMHCLLFPSLHDSSGNVVLEAQANGLPVVCLDLGGPATLVSDETAIVVATRNESEAGVVQRLAEALQQLAEDESARAAMGKAALERVRATMGWEARVNGALALLAETRGRAHCEAIRGASR